MIRNFLFDLNSRFVLKGRAVIISSCLSIFIYIFAFITYYVSNYQYGHDYALEKVVRNSDYIYVFLVVSFNIFVLILFFFLMKKLISRNIFIIRSTNSPINWALLSIPNFLINFYYLNNVTDRILAKEISSNFLLINSLYFCLAYQGWTVLTSRNKIVVLLSILLIFATGLLQFEREPFLFAFFGILMRILSSEGYKKLPLYVLILLIFFTSISFFSKEISRLFYKEDGLQELYEVVDTAEKYRNPILKGSGDLATKMSLEVVYLSDNFRPNYLRRRIFVPVQLERLFVPDTVVPLSNGAIATNRYISKSNTHGALGFSMFLDFYISFGFLSLFVIPFLYAYIFKYTSNIQINFLLVNTIQAWFFKLQRSDFWPSVIPYAFLIILIIFISIFKKNSKTF